jgi:diadenosine tetraphosphatase ApaH/serine/threonine PP2A family protein phosphatase
MRAIISDLHSNIEALEAVMGDIASQGATEILCLGDVVGYGPDPEECLDIVEKMCRFCLSGNHDFAVLTRAERFNPLAVEAVDYTRNVLKPGGFFSFGRKKARWEFLETRNTRQVDDDVLYVHGSPRDDRNEYILESDIVFGNVDKVTQIFEQVPRLLFVGHTHVPGVITTEMTFWHPDDNGSSFELKANMKHIINVGSVGQPRDGDNRACYVLFDGARLIYRRVPYNFRKTMEKMARVGPISRDAADRLEYGR